MMILSRHYMDVNKEVRHILLSEKQPKKNS